jgi:hypothetical protein
MTLENHVTHVDAVTILAVMIKKLAFSLVVMSSTRMVQIRTVVLLMVQLTGDFLRTQ